jgi:hypothetical protein
MAKARYGLPIFFEIDANIAAQIECVAFDLAEVKGPRPPSPCNAGSALAAFAPGAFFPQPLRGPTPPKVLREPRKHKPGSAPRSYQSNRNPGKDMQTSMEYVEALGQS